MDAAEKGLPHGRHLLDELLWRLPIAPSRAYAVVKVKDADTCILIVGPRARAVCEGFGEEQNRASRTRVGIPDFGIAVLDRIGGSVCRFVASRGLECSALHVFAGSQFPNDAGESTEGFPLDALVVVRIDSETEEAAAVVGAEATLFVWPSRRGAKARAFHSKAVAIGTRQMGVGQELVEEPDDNGVVGELFQWSRDVIALVFGQRFGLVADPFGVHSHLIGLVGFHGTRDEQPPAGVEEVFLFLGQLYNRLAIRVCLGLIIGTKLKLHLEVLVHDKGFVVVFAHVFS